MSESQFEKLLKTLSKKDAEIERLREENKQLRGLLERCQPWDICRDNLKKDVSNE